MTSRDFCYWLQGFFEVGYPISISPEQTATIKAHLAMVFHHEIDPSHGSFAHQEELRKIHEGKQPETYCATPEAKPKEQFPDGAPVALDPILTALLPADWKAKLPSGSGGAMNC
jgi:hypothetical protein